MHVVFRESHGLEETATPFDPGQTPADLVVLSFSDSDLGAFAAGWHRAGDLPSLRLCNLSALRHPVSVDAYAETVLTHARAILIRVIGGESYWSHGLAVVQDIARRKGIALAVIPGDGREDARLDALSTLPVSTLRRLSALCEAGGEVAAHAALAQLALAAGFYAGPVAGVKTVPPMGLWRAEGIETPELLVVFYRSWLVAADTAPIDALIDAFRARGIAAVGAFVPSLKAEGVADWLAGFAVKAVVNATAFSAQDAAGRTPFDGMDSPVFQVALSSARRKDWAASDRGMSPPDLAMNVVLPEVDGRIFAGVVSFKAPSPRDPDLQYSRFVHRPDPARIEAAVARVMAWIRLRETPKRKIAVVLSTYPGRPHQMAHAIGLDALASARALLDDLGAPSFEALGEISWPLAEYLAALPPRLRDGLEGDPADHCVDGAFRFAATRCGDVLVALQPERGGAADGYHDLSRVPGHGYVAFYLWLRAQRMDAMVHMGAHGTLEWLPGKSVALSDACWPEALVGAMPVIYPFIVNDPGEAAQAKRRIGAVTLGHLPPPLAPAALPEGLARLERLLDEYSTADGLDPARRDRLVGAIRDEARAQGVEDDLALPPDAMDAIPRIDRFVCDLKESRFGDGLHIYGQAKGEREGLMAALSGLRVAPGPAGSPARGRSDVLPTGRNMFSVDPRAVPSPAAHAQGIRLADELLRRHLQDHGDWPRGLVVDLWASATMRTAGEDFAMALHLAGLEPIWDEATGRVTGIAIIAPALLDRPRIDVTLRVSGLFRDVFPGLAQMFEMGAAALSARNEAANPYAARGPRVFGPQPGQYGLGLNETDRKAAAEAWLAASSWAIGTDGESRHTPGAIADRVRGADAFVHSHDLAESDLLLAADYAAHLGGFAAAAASLGTAPALYHLDATGSAPGARALPEEIARIVRARAANPDWAAGMMRHGFRGAAEIAATVEHLAAFARLTHAVPPHLFDLCHDATLGSGPVAGFMADHNPAALAALRDLFRRMADEGLWQTRRNSIAAAL
ncbi:cobaltochelatase subunit CobN [Cereibacter sp. SYSU M97828]|nr:cobaltochelatase subunit CobN [Cereibacter flavus]